MNAWDDVEHFLGAVQGAAGGLRSALERFCADRGIKEDVKELSLTELVKMANRFKAVRS